MKSRSFIPLLLLCIGITVGTPVPSAQAEARVSFSFFYDNLSPHGEWVTVGNYGTAWHPTHVDPEWSPYTEGYWAYTDDGWTWVSDEPWADVAYHYGRWVDVDGYGWCWVPGYEWAPAWVSWRSSDDYVGWAPLPPEAEWQPTVGFSIWTDSYYDIGPRYYRFCRVRDFGEPNMRRVCRPWHENISLMSVTFNITNINYNHDDRRVFVGGPNLAYLRERTARPVRHFRLVEEDRYQRSAVRGDELRIFRPSIDKDRDRERVRTSIARTFEHGKIDRGWRDSGNDDERRDLRGRMQDQVRGLSPQNAPATVVAKAVGGLSARELAAKQERRSKDKSEVPQMDPRVRDSLKDGRPDGTSDNRPGDRDGVGKNDKTKGPFVDPRRPDAKDDRGDDSRGGPGKPKDMIPDPRSPDSKGKGKGKGNDPEDIRRGIPMPEDRTPSNKKGNEDNTPGRQVDPRKAPGGGGIDDRPDARKGIPVPPDAKRMPGGREGNDRDGGTTRPPIPPKVTPDSAPRKDDKVDRPPTPRKPDEPKKSEDIQRPEGRPPGARIPQERPAMPKRPESPKVQESPPTPKRMDTPPAVQRPSRPAPEVQRPKPAPEVQRPPVQKKVEAPRVEQRPAPTPKPQPQSNRGGGGGEKGKGDKKKDKDDR